MSHIVLKLVLLCKLAALVTSAPIQNESLAEILDNKNSIDEKGNYKFSFETTNGILRYEQGKVVNVGEPDEHIVVSGYYSYIDDTGNRVRIDYTADENGYQLQKFIPSVTAPFSGIPTNVLISLSG